jgi:pyruvate dehydrogenase E2 component (dihydrolipoamide acetyltransferase)
MAEKLLMIALSPTMEQGTIHKWHVKEGESFSTGDILCDVETDKTTMEYEAPDDAVLLKILIKEGGQATVGQPIAVYGEMGDEISDILRELKEKEDTDPNAENAGAGERDGKNKTAVPEPKPESPESSSGTRITASPLARKIAGEKGIDLRRIKGSGPGGRIIKKDVEAFKPSAIPSISSNIPISGDDTKIPLSDKRTIIAKRLSESKYSAPHFYLTLKADMTRLIESRLRFNEDHPESKTSLNAWIMKLTAEALKRHPEINATWNSDSILKFFHVHIGLAVAQKDGLITPLVKAVEMKKISQIDEELKVLIDKAKNNRLTPDEYTGATFTISNLGSWGIEEFTAIINPPGSAILALGAIQKIPVVIHDQIVIRPMMAMTLSCDHRVIDGAAGADFMKTLKSYLEDPALAMI